MLEAKGGKPLGPAQRGTTMDRQVGTETTLDLLKRLALTKDELEIIAIVEKGKGRKLTRQEINLSLKQARDLGVI